MDRVRDAVARGCTADVIAAVEGSRRRSTFALTNAIGRRNLEIVQCLVQSCDADINYTYFETNSRQTGLHRAAAYGSVEIAQYFVLGCGADTEAKDIRGMTALHLAITEGNNVEMAQCLVQTCGADVNAKDNSGRAALHYASASKNLTMVQCLAQTCGADVNAKDKCGRTVLHCASASNNVEMIQCLVQTCGVDVEAKDPCGLTALHHASALGSIKAAQYLIEAGADAYAPDLSGMTPLQRAASNDCYNRMTQFLHNVEGANTRPVGKSGIESALQIANFTKNALKMHGLLVSTDGQNVDPQDAALQRAIYSSSARMLQRLVDSTSVNIDATDENGMTAVHHVSMSRNECNAPAEEPDANDDVTDLRAAIASTLDWRMLDIATYLVQTGGANVDAQDKKGKTALHCCVHSGNSEIGRLLVATSHASLDIPDSDDCTTLQYAVKRRYMEMVQCLIQTGKVNVERKDKDGKTLLHHLINDNSIPLVRYLIENGASSVVNSVDNDGMTALHHACTSGCIGLVECLVLSCGADVDATNANGTTALHLASQRGSLRLITSLVQTCGANVDAVDDKGMTALHFAIMHNIVHNVEYLVQSGRAKVNVMDKSGWTALHHACHARGTVACTNKASILIKAGASVVAINGDGHNPIHIASSRGHGYLRLVRLLIAQYPYLEY
jgi:ankyrin repeat protein